MRPPERILVRKMLVSRVVAVATSSVLVALLLVINSCTSMRDYHTTLVVTIRALNRGIQELYEKDQRLPDNLRDVQDRAQGIGDIAFAPFYEIVNEKEIVLWYDASDFWRHANGPVVLKNPGQTLDRKADVYCRFRVGVGEVEASWDAPSDTKEGER